MKTIKLDDNYSVKIDTYNFSLESEFTRYDEKKKKDVISKNEWHFPHFRLAIEKYMNECIKPLESIVEVQKELLRIEKLILTFK